MLTVCQQRRNGLQRVCLEQGRGLFMSRSCAVVVILGIFTLRSFCHVRVVVS